MTEFPLILSTAVAPPKQILLDGVEYDLLGADNLSPEQEAEAMALFSRHSLIQQQLDMTDRLTDGQAIAARLRTCRILILSKLTSIPRDVAEKLPLSVQVVLLQAIQTEMEAEPDDDMTPAAEDGVDDV